MHSIGRHIFRKIFIARSAIKAAAAACDASGLAWAILILSLLACNRAASRARLSHCTRLALCWGACFHGLRECPVCTCLGRRGTLFTVVANRAAYTRCLTNVALKFPLWADCIQQRDRTRDISTIGERHGGEQRQRDAKSRAHRCAGTHHGNPQSLDHRCKFPGCTQVNVLSQSDSSFRARTRCMSSRS